MKRTAGYSGRLGTIFSDDNIKHLKLFTSQNYYIHNSNGLIQRKSNKTEWKDNGLKHCKHQTPEDRMAYFAYLFSFKEPSTSSLHE